MFREFAAGAHGGDFDFGVSPTGEITDILHAVFLEVEEADDDLFAGLEGGDEPIEKFAHGGEIFLPIIALTGEVLFDDFSLAFAEVRVADEWAGLVAAEPIVAGVDGDAGDPVGEGLFTDELVELEEDFGEGFLGEVFVVGLAADLVADDFVDLGIENFHELAPSFFLSNADAVEKIGGDRGWIGHGFRGQGDGSCLGRRGKGELISGCKMLQFC